ncbi:MAG TPA: CHAT domain-containing protein [Phaeodactylibacter sp.]|nr:CHAT domain-containing protein [Phaeodactylibacter sp.]
MTKEEIQQLIINGQIKEALEALKMLLPNEHQNTVLLLQQRQSRLSYNLLMGLIDFRDSNIEQNKITQSALGLLSELDTTLGNASVENNGVESYSSKAKPTTKSILFAAANPSDQARIQTGMEWRSIKEEMQKGNCRDNYSFLPVQTAVRITELMRAFHDKPTIIHFAGHGEEAGIIISTDNNEGLLLNDAAIKRLFNPLNGHTELVILNNCYSGEQAKLISSLGIIVIGHSLPIEDDSAISFSKGFYLGLSEGMDYKAAFNAGYTTLLAENKSADSLIVWQNGESLDW